MEAMNLALTLMNSPMKNIPKLALDYADHLSKKVGFCGEIFVTAFAHYAQAVEGLQCNYGLYVIGNEGKTWFANNQSVDP